MEMSVSDSITHAALVSQVNGIVSAAGSRPAATGGAFKNGVVTTYGPDGSQKAAVGQLSFDQTQFASDGSITGGQILHSSATPDGQPLTSTTIQLAPGGKPTQAEMQIHNRQGDGIYSILNADLSALQWTDAGKISSGNIGLATKDPVTGLPTTSGSMVFQNEKFTSGSLTHYSPKDGKTVDSLTELDYSETQLVGLKVTGGQMKVTRKNPDQTISSTSQVFFVNNGLGRVHQIQTANMVSGYNQLKSNVTAEYSGLTYNARNEIDSGDLNIDVKAPDQTPVSHAVISFAGAVPTTAQSWRFQGGVLANKTVTDYSNAKFDNHNRIVNGSIKVDVYDGAEQRLSSTSMSYDQNGTVTNKQTQTFPVAATKPTPMAYPEVAAQWNNPSAQSSSAAQPQATVAKAASVSTAPAAGAANAAPQTKNVYRSDGTLEETVITTSQNGKPVSSVVTHYDIDGKTIVNTFNIDLTKVVMPTGPGKPSGSVSLQEFTGGTTLHSESTFNYS